MKLFCNYRGMRLPGGPSVFAFLPLLIFLYPFACFLTDTCLEFLGLNSAAELIGIDQPLRGFTRALAFAVITPPAVSACMHLTKKGAVPEGCRSILFSFSLAMILLFLLPLLSRLLDLPRVMQPVLLYQFSTLICTAIFFVSHGIALLCIPVSAGRTAPKDLFVFRILSFLILFVVPGTAAFSGEGNAGMAFAFFCCSAMLRGYVLKGCGMAADMWGLLACASFFFLPDGSGMPDGDPRKAIACLLLSKTAAAFYALSLLSLFLPSCRNWLLAEYDGGTESKP